MRTFINIVENQTRLFYHGSNVKLNVGTVLKPSDDYETNWGSSGFYIGLERYRPPNMLKHSQAVFMCDNPDDIDSAGGGTDWLFTVKPTGFIQKHDMNWSSEMSIAMDNGDTEERIREIAENYWNGVPHPNESLWEYLTPSAIIVAVEPY